MLRKIKRYLANRKAQAAPRRVPKLYTREDVIAIVEEAKVVAYNDGKRDGLNIARTQATNSLKEILWQQRKAEQRNQ